MSALHSKFIEFLMRLHRETLEPNESNIDIWHICGYLSSKELTRRKEEASKFLEDHKDDFSIDDNSWIMDDLIKMINKINNELELRNK